MAAIELNIDTSLTTVELDIVARMHSLYNLILKTFFPEILSINLVAFSCHRAGGEKV